MIKKKKEIFFLNIIFIFLLILFIFMPVILPKTYFTAIDFNISFYIIFNIISFASYSFYYKEDEANIKSLIAGVKENFIEALIISVIKLSIISALIFLLRYFLKLKTITGYFFQYSFFLFFLFLNFLFFGILP